MGAAGLAYGDGLSAWWWVGSAGLGSLVFAFFVAPKLWQIAKTHDFYTTGDYLEFRYGPAVRGLTTALVAVGALALLAGQLIAGATILNVLTGMPRWAGALTGGAIMTVYFTAGGLLGSAWVNSLQLIVMLLGLLIALPFAVGSVGGFAALTGASVPASFGDIMYSSGPNSGWTLLFLLGPAFIISPGLIQKAYGGASATRRSHRRRVERRGASGLCLCTCSLRDDRQSCAAGHHRRERGAPDSAHADASAMARRDRAGGGVLDRGGHV